MSTVGRFLVGVSLFSAVGCGGANQPIARGPEPVIQQQQERIVTLQDSLQMVERNLSAAEQTAAMEAEAAREARSRLDAFEAVPVVQTAGRTDLLPPDAVPGRCYARVFIPPTYRTIGETVLARDSLVDYEVIPASYDWVEERVLVREASERLEVVPAVYRWTEEQVLVKPAETRIEEIPAVYDWVEERVVDQPAHMVWKKGRGAIERVDEATGEIMCLVEVPATYKTVRKQILRTPAQTRELSVPAEYESVRRRVVTTPATTRTITLPAEYSTVRTRRLIEPARTRRVVTPPLYQTVTRSELEKDGYMEWRTILCETNVTPRVISELQRALRQAGHNPGPIDGVLGRQTMVAMSAYQRAQGLASGQLTMETLERLGVRLATMSTGL